MFLHTRSRLGRLPQALAVAAAAVALITTVGVAAPSPARAATDVEVTKDLAYAPAQPAGTQGHLLDLYVPRSDRPVPLVIFTSGSGRPADSGRTDADKVAAQLVMSCSAGHRPAGGRERQAHRRPGPAHARRQLDRRDADGWRFRCRGRSSGGGSLRSLPAAGERPPGRRTSGRRKG